MKTFFLSGLVALSVMLYEFTPVTTKSFKVDSSKTKITVNGTSSFHNWEVSVTKSDGDLTMQLTPGNMLFLIDQKK